MATPTSIRESFALFDRDGDGELTASEAQLAIRSNGVVLTNDEASTLPPTMNWAQFESWMSKKLSTCNPEQDMVNSFKNFDTNGDGTISTEELAQTWVSTMMRPVELYIGTCPTPGIQVMKTLGDLLSDEEVEKMVNEADPNKTGRINYAAFVKKLLTS